jgi:uncharacterized surface protein with fasciclin (FAS1) repeats
MFTSAPKFLAGLAAAGLLASPFVAEAGRKCGVPVHAVAYKEAAQMDIVDTAVNAGSFNTLATALKAAGLVEVLKGDGPFTVFAPTDEAFAKLPKGTVEALLKDKKKLASVLTYHVVPGSVKAADVAGMDSAKTVQGQKLMIDSSEGVMINNAKVVKADIVCTNGVIHVIDTVLMPK